MQYHPVKLICSAIKTEHIELPCEPVDGICAVTGEFGAVILRKHLFGKSFTNIDLLARPDSDMVSVEAYQALKYKWERMSSYFCDGSNFQRLDRVGVRNMVFADQMPDCWIGYATTSYKKHGALRTPVNTGNRRLWLFEMQVVDCTNMQLVVNWWETLNNYLRSGLGRTTLETLECPPYLIRNIGLQNWLSLKKWAFDKYKSPVYQFLCYLLPSQEELKNERVKTTIKTGQITDDLTAI